MKPERARVFFALWPDAGTRTALAAAARRLQRALHGRRTRDDSIHLTLAFLGDLPLDRLGALLAPPAIAAVPFTLVLDRCGCWPRNGIGWVAPGEMPPALDALAEGLGTWLRAAGFRMEERPFRPHVTLIRDAHCVALPDNIAPIEWRVKAFVLLRSTRAAAGSRYEIIGRWPLTG